MQANLSLACMLAEPRRSTASESATQDNAMNDDMSIVTESSLSAHQQATLHYMTEREIHIRSGKEKKTSLFWRCVPLCLLPLKVD